MSALTPEEERRELARMRGINPPRWFKPGVTPDAPARCPVHRAKLELVRRFSGHRIVDGPSGRPVTRASYHCFDCGGAGYGADFWREAGTGLIYLGWHNVSIAA